MIRKFVGRATYGVPRWLKISCIGCSAALLATLIMTGILAVISITLYTGPTEGDAQAEILIRNSEGAVRTPRWSSDGQSIVVNIDTAIYGVGVDGKHLWNIPSRRNGNQYSPTLALDDQVAYLRFVPRKWPRLRWRYHIATARIDGGGAKSLDSFYVLGGWDPTIPTLSPDGSSIAYLAETHNDDRRDYKRVIRIMAIDGNGSHDVDLLYDRETPTQEIVWSNNSETILVHYDYPIHQLEMINVFNGDREVIVESDTDQIFSKAWSSDGRRVYVSQRNHDTDVYSLFSTAKDGTDKRIIVELEPYWSIVDIRPSPNRETIMFTSFRFPSDRGSPIVQDKLIYLIDKNKANPRVIINHVGKGTSATPRFTRIWAAWSSIWTSWSPTGERIAAYNDDPNAEIVLYTMSPDGSDAKILIRRNSNGDLIPGHAEPFGPAAGAADIIPPNPRLHHHQAN